MVNGLVHPETQSPRKSEKRKKDHPKQNRDETSRNTGFFPLSTYKSIFNQMLYCSKIFLP